MSIKDTILKAIDVQLHPVEVPEWNCTVYVRAMTGGERASFFRDYKQADRTDDTGKLIVTLLVKTLCDDQGKRIFADNEGELLAGKSGTVLERIWSEAVKANRLAPEDVADAKKG